MPHENRSLLNRTFLVMLMACDLDSAIADPLDEAQNEVIRIVEERDDSTGVGKAYLALYDTVAAMEEFTPDHVDMKRSGPGRTSTRPCASWRTRSSTPTAT